MKQPIYKFEKYMEPDFPIYTSSQQNSDILAYAHYHKAAEIILVSEGTVQVMVGTKSYICHKGEIIFVPPHTIHEVTSLDHEACIRGIIFDFSILVAAHIDIKFQEIFNSPMKLKPIITSNHMYYEQIYSYAQLVLDTYDRHSSTGKMQLFSYLMLITSYLIQIYAPSEDTVTDQNHIRLRPVLQYIEEHLAEKIQISDLSALIYTCDKQLIRIFKAVTGEPPVKYIMNLRIEAAMKLLVSTKLSVSDIAEQTGFGTANYMNRVFKQKLKMSPHHYRKINGSS